MSSVWFVKHRAITTLFYATTSGKHVHTALHMTQEIDIESEFISFQGTL